MVATIIAMPLTLNTRALDTGEATVRNEVGRIAALKEVREACAALQKREPDWRKFQLAVTAIPAPPFGESKRAEWLAQRFRELGLENIEIDKAGNVIALARGTDPKAKWVALTGHIDTVFPAETRVEVRSEGSRLIGPGVSDNGTGITALYAIAAALKTGNLRTRAGVLLVGNVGEEGEGDLRGMRYLFNDSKYKQQIGRTLVLDGAGVDAIVTQGLGSRRFEVTIKGPGGHSWSDFGVPNPIVILARAIARFSSATVPGEPRTSFNVGVIEGGTSVNSIPESARARVDIRSAAGKEIDRLEKLLRDSISGAVKEAQPSGRKPAVTFEVTLIGSRPAADLKPGARILGVIRAVDQTLGLKADVRRASTDANVPLSLGREAISIGAGGSGGGAHTANEWFDASGRELGLKRILLAVVTLAELD